MRSRNRSLLLRNAIFASHLPVYKPRPILSPCINDTMRNFVWQALLLISVKSSFASPIFTPRASLWSSKTAKVDLRDIQREHKRSGETAIEPASTPIPRLYEAAIGASGRTFALQFDTGSADLWVYDASMEPAVGSHHTFYSPGPSASLVQNAKWDISYGDGSYGVSGVVYLDTVTFGNISVTKQSIEVATSIHGSSIQQTPYDGIIGLNLGSNTISPAEPTFLDNVYGSLDSPVFTTKLTRSGEADGYYTFGYINQTVVGNETIHYANIVDTTVGYWAFNSSLAIIGGHTVPLPANVAFADTGTAYICVSYNEAYYSLIEGANCNANIPFSPCIYPANVELPPITMYIGDYGITLTDADLNWGSAASYGYEGYNIGSLQPRIKGIPYDIFGVPLLVNVYAVYNFTKGQEKLGVVPRARGI